MKLRSVTILCVSAIVVLASHSPVNACTILMLETDDAVLVGSNEDFNDPFTAVRFTPATEGEHGRALFGFSGPSGSLATTGGINDQGLFIDGNGVSATGWEPEDGKPDFRGIVEAHVLANFATVAETIEWFRSTNVYILARAKFLLADKTGASAVVEWSEGRLQAVNRTKGYQISTNFLQSNYPQGPYPCYRYRTAEAMLAGADGYSVDLIRDVLSATHFEGASTTLFSYIGNLKTGDIYIYNFHDFNEVTRFNLHEEVARGGSEHFIPALSPRISYAQHRFVPRALSAAVEQISENPDLDKIVKWLKDLKQLCLAVYDRDYTESVINNLGYDYLAEGRTEDAIKVFRLNTIEHPESANTFDSLGEAYMKNGDHALAIRNYRRSLELDPHNDNAKKMLTELAKAVGQ